MTSTAQEAPFVNNGNCTVGEAIEAADTNLIVDGCAAGTAIGPDTIMLPAGSYDLSAMLEDAEGPTGLPSINSNLILQGAGAPTTILRRVAGSPEFRILHVGDGAGSVTINALTITGGAGATLAGGGIRVRGGDLTLNNCVLSQNTAGLTGGALNDSLGRTLVLNGTTLQENFATGNGGAIEWSGPVTFADSLFTGNRANGDGGAVSLASGMGTPVTITRSTFQNNTSFGYGAAVTSTLGAPVVVITLSTFTGNMSTNGDGGALDFSTGTTTLTDSSFLSNVARQPVSGHGGAVHLGGNVTIRGSTFAGNSGTLGGALWLGFGSFSVSNTTISGNSAATGGGGIRVGSATVNLNNVTVSLNTADDDANDDGEGGGILDEGGSLVTLKNTVIGGNTDHSPTGTLSHDCLSTLASSGFNLLGIDTGCAFIATASDLVGTAANPVDPLLAPLADNGGPTLTHAPLLSSPIVDAGSPSSPGSGGDACEVQDQRGTTRPLDGDGNGNSVCDMGAVELRIFALTVSTSGAGSGTVTSVPAGIACPADCAENYASGTVVSLQAAAGAGSVFTGWSGDCTGAAACSFAMDAQRSVTATFVPADYTMGVSPPTQTVNAGQAASYTVTVTPNPAPFSAVVMLRCSLPAGMSATCGFSSSSVTPGANPATSTLTVTTAPAMSFRVAPSSGWANRLLYGVWLALGAMALAGVVVVKRPPGRRGRGWFRFLFFLGLLAALALDAAGCGSQTQEVVAPRSYTITVTATSGAITHSTTATLAVR